MTSKVEYVEFIACMQSVHQWETSKNPLLSTIVGRHIYICIISEIEQNYPTKILSKSLKQIFTHPTLTDKAIRLKLRDLEAKGYIKTEVNDFDARAKRILVTDKFVALMNEHKKVVTDSYRNVLLLL